MKIEQIRQIGDKILHETPEKVDFKNPKWNLNKVYEQMLADLEETGGVGVAANQSAAYKNPPSMTIVGIPNDKVRKIAQKRYPDEELPDAIVLINPEIINFSDETYFPKHGEGCLSVMGSLRARVPRHEWIEVRYFDMDGEEHTEVFEGFKAHVAQHEIDHLNGVVYLEKIFIELSQDQKKAFLSLADNILEKKEEVEKIDISPSLTFDRDESGQIIYNDDNLAKDLAKLSKITLKGMRARLQYYINNPVASEQACSSSFHQSEKKREPGRSGGGPSANL
jgi:peptide deformylase